MIVVVDYGLGNLGSIANMLKRVGAPGVISGDPEVIAGASKLILPGVGAFDHGMERLGGSDLIPLLTRKVKQEKTPVLGLCLGMQLFARRSEEGTAPGLGWLRAEVVRFNFERSPETLRVPHMGWNTLRSTRPHPVLDMSGEGARFYFVHSFHVVCEDPSLQIAHTDYGYEFASVIGAENIIGVQFHPEKSHRFGMRLFEAFAAWSPGANGNSP
jgi:glutamine amidotransferase